MKFDCDIQISRFFCQTCAFFRIFLSPFLHFPSPGFVLPPRRLAVAFVEGVAGYAGTKRHPRCRWQDKRACKAGERLSGTRQGGLMTNLGLFPPRSGLCRPQGGLCLSAGWWSSPLVASVSLGGGTPVFPAGRRCAPSQAFLCPCGSRGVPLRAGTEEVGVGLGGGCDGIGGEGRKRNDGPARRRGRNGVRMHASASS